MMCPWMPFDSWIPSDDRDIFLRHCVEIYTRLNMSQQVKNWIRDTQGRLSRKNMTSHGKDRKKKVTQRMFYERKKIRRMLHFYSCSFPLFKRYTVLSQTKEPMLHKVNDEQTTLLKERVPHMHAKSSFAGMTSVE